MIIKLANEDIDLLTLLLTKIHLYTRNWLRYLVSISVSISNSRHIYTLIANELIHIEGFTTAILEGGNNETVLHENRSYFPGEKMYCFCPPTWQHNDVTWKCSILDCHKTVHDFCYLQTYLRTTQATQSAVAWEYMPFFSWALLH